MGKEEYEEKEKNVSLTITTSGWPISLFREWDKNCVGKFGNCRWMKMWHDHLASEQLDVFITLIDKIEELRFRVEKLEKQPPKEEGVKTLGGIQKK